MEQPANPDLGYQFTPTPSGGYWSNSQGDHWTYNQDNAQWTNEHTGDKWQVNGDGSSTHISGPQPDNKPPEKSGPTPTGDDLGDEGDRDTIIIWERHALQQLIQPSVTRTIRWLLRMGGLGLSVKDQMKMAIARLQEQLSELDPDPILSRNAMFRIAQQHRIGGAGGYDAVGGNLDPNYGLNQGMLRWVARGGGRSFRYRPDYGGPDDAIGGRPNT